MFVCWKRYSTKTIVILILKYLAKYFRIRITIAFVLYLSQQTNTYSKSAAETLKQEVKPLKGNSRDCPSLLTACSIYLRLCSSVFWCTMNKSLLTAMFLLLRFPFRCLYCQLFEQISHLNLILSVISFALCPGKATGVFFIRVFSEITQYLKENACVEVSF